MRFLLLFALSACAPDPRTASTSLGPITRADEDRALVAAVRCLWEMDRKEEDYPYLWRSAGGLLLPPTLDSPYALRQARYMAAVLAAEGWSDAPGAALDLIDRGSRPSRTPEDVSALGGGVQVLESFRSDRRRWFQPTRPGFSKDGRWALVVGSIGPGDSYHGPGTAAVLLERVHGEWLPRGRTFAYGM